MKNIIRNIFTFSTYPFNTDWHREMFGVGKKLFDGDFVLELDKSTFRFHKIQDEAMVVTYKEYTFIVSHYRDGRILTSDVPVYEDRGKYIDCQRIFMYSDYMNEESYNWYTSKYSNDTLDQHQRYIINDKPSNIINPRTLGHSKPTRSRNVMDYII